MMIAFSKARIRRRFLYFDLCIMFLIFIASLSGCTFGGVIKGQTYEEAERYSIGDFTYNARTIDRITINWYIGHIEVIKSDQEELMVKESGQGLIASQRLHWLLEDGQLNVQFWESGYLSNVNQNDKHLTIEIPKGIAINISTISAPFKTMSLEATDLELTSVSGSVTIGELVCERAQITSTSGRISIEEAVINNDIYLGSVSGRIEILATIAPNIKIKSTSGKIKAALQQNCHSLDIGTTSGNVEIAMDDFLGATILYKTTSGRLTIKKDYVKENDKYIIGDGMCDMLIHTTSGNLTII